MSKDDLKELKAIHSMALGGCNAGSGTVKDTMRRLEVKLRFLIKRVEK